MGMPAVRDAGDHRVYQLLRGITPPGVALRRPWGPGIGAGHRLMDVLAKEMRGRRISVRARQARVGSSGAAPKGLPPKLGTKVRWLAAAMGRRSCSASFAPPPGFDRGLTLMVVVRVAALRFAGRKQEVT